MKASIERLNAFGIKPSIQREAIIDYLLTHRTHPTVDTIYQDLSSTMATLSKTTVYNTLKLFSEKGAIQTINIEDNMVRYDSDISNHAHFKCIKCGNVYDMNYNDEAVERISFPNCYGFKITERQLYLKGICPHCQENT